MFHSNWHSFSRHAAICARQLFCSAKNTEWFMSVLFPSNFIESFDWVDKPRRSFCPFSASFRRRKKAVSKHIYLELFSLLISQYWVEKPRRHVGVMLLIEIPAHLVIECQFEWYMNGGHWRRHKIKLSDIDFLLDNNKEKRMRIFYFTSAYFRNYLHFTSNFTNFTPDFSIFSCFSSIKYSHSTSICILAPRSLS